MQAKRGMKMRKKNQISVLVVCHRSYDNHKDNIILLQVTTFNLLQPILFPCREDSLIVEGGFFPLGSRPIGDMDSRRIYYK